MCIRDSFSDEVRSRYRDWVGYHDCVSPAALAGFARDKGYRLKPGDITDEGYLNDVNRIPSQRYLDWIDYNHRTVCEIGREWTDMVHKAGRQTMMFYCDHHIGTARRAAAVGQHPGRLRSHGPGLARGGREARRVHVGEAHERDLQAQPADYAGPARPARLKR